jgi:hypothetical protein
VTRKDVEQKRLDTKAIASEMGDAWMTAHKKPVKWTEWNVIDKTPGDASAAAPAPKPQPRKTAAAKALEPA